MRPRISVVIPTHNRRDSLLRLLRALREGTYPHERFDVVIVADGCTDDTVAVLHRTPFPFAMRVLEQSPGHGAGAARNLGAAHAAGALLVFLDDDIEPLPTLLEAHARAHADGGDRMVIGPALPRRPERCGFHELSVWAWWEEQFQRMRRPGYRFTFMDVLSGNCSLPAACFVAVGGFDATLPESCRDDFELGARLIARGVRIAFAPDAAGYHHDATDRPRLMRRKRAEGKADVALARRHPHLTPALPLAAPRGRAWSRSGLLRRLAFRGWLGNVLAAALLLSMDALEFLRLRGSWRRLQGGVQSYWYWRGVADAVGTQRALAELLGRTTDSAGATARAGAGTRTASVIELDLRDEIGAVERRLDEEQPDGAHLHYGIYDIGLIAPQPGAERLRGEHLRPVLATTLAGPLLRALLIEAAAGAADIPAAAAAVAGTLWRLGGGT